MSAVSELLIPDAVDDDVPATVGCQNPKGKVGEVTPFIPQNVPDDKHCDGRERSREGHRQRPDRFRRFDVGKRWLRCGLAFRFRQVFPPFRMLPDAG